MKKSILTLLLFAIIFLIACGESGNDDSSPKVKQVKIKEKSQPLEFVKIVKVSDEANVWGTNVRFEITINNNAKFTTYKEASVSIDWLDKDSNIVATIIRKEANHSYPPGTSHIIKFKLSSPPNTSVSNRVTLKELNFANQK